MIRLFVTSLLVTAWHQAHAADGAEIAEAAMECWPVSDVRAVEGFSALVTAKISEDGSALFKVQSFEPKTKIAEITSEAVFRALNRCAPYNIAPGTYQFTMKYESPF